LVLENWSKVSEVDLAEELCVVLCLEWFFKTGVEFLKWM
jgi:hypothetical protein